MNKLATLILLLLVTWNSFSQTDTIVKLEQPIAKLVIKDLIQGDGAQLELHETQTLLKLERQKLALKDTIIFNLESKIVNLSTIIFKQEQQFKFEREKSDELLSELKGQKRVTLLYKIGAYVGAAAIVGILVKQ